MKIIKKIRIEEIIVLTAWLISNLIVNHFNRPYVYNIFMYFIFLHRVVLSFSYLYPILIVFLLYQINRKSPQIEKLQSKPFHVLTINFIRDWLPLFITFIIYSNLKILLALKRVHYDDFLYNLDKILLFRFSFVDFFKKFHGSIFWDTLFGKSYIFFFASFFAACFLVYYYAPKKTFRKFQLSLILIYLIGLILYFLFPALGPAFLNIKHYTAFTYEPINTLIRTLWNTRNYFLQNPTEYLPGIFEGIAAFPSLHIAHTFCFLIYIKKINKSYLFYLFLLWFILNYLSTMYVGMHYFVDGLAGCFLTIIVYIIVEKYLIK